MDEAKFNTWGKKSNVQFVHNAIPDYYAVKSQ